jgi:hypothetical protein
MRLKRASLAITGAPLRLAAFEIASALQSGYHSQP